MRERDKLPARSAGVRASQGRAKTTDVFSKKSMRTHIRYFLGLVTYLAFCSVFVSVLQCVVVCCRCVALCCSVFQCPPSHVSRFAVCFAIWCSEEQSMLQCVAVCCSALQRVAACCIMLWCVPVCCSVLQCPLTHLAFWDDKQTRRWRPSHTRTLYIDMHTCMPYPGMVNTCISVCV